MDPVTYPRVRRNELLFDEYFNTKVSADWLMCSSIQFKQLNYRAEKDAMLHDILGGNVYKGIRQTP